MQSERYAYLASGTGGYALFLLSEDGQLMQIGHVDQQYWAVAVVEALNAAEPLKEDE